MIGIIDIGGTNIKYGVIDPKTEKYKMLGDVPTETTEVDFQMENRLDSVLSLIKKEIEISGIAISTAGIVNSETGEIIFANQNIPNYKGTKLKEYLEEKYEIPTSVENDVNSALLGELYFGEIEQPNSALMLTIGTGLGGALYLNDGIYHGHTHSAGEVGYSILGQKNIEKKISTSALVHNVQNRLNDNQIDGRWIFDQAINHQNEVCIQEINDLVKNLALVINNFIALINPEYVILGGGIMEQEDYLKPLLIEEITAINRNELTKVHTKIKFASIGNQAGMLGAYTHYKNQNESKK